MKPNPTIADVIRAQADSFLTIPGVVGMYEGLMNDTIPCITIMVVEKTRDLQAKLPQTLHGYPVQIEETGVIRPMQ
jgi:hypothetical protein